MVCWLEECIRASMDQIDDCEFSVLPFGDQTDFIVFLCAQQKNPSWLEDDHKQIPLLLEWIYM